MRKARLFKDGTIVDAYDVFENRVSRDSDFVDVEEDFRVRYWKGAKNNGRPHFKLYLSRDDYKKLTTEQKTRLEILKSQRHYQESIWHRDWEAKLESIAEIEKTITDPVTKQRKRADAYIEGLKSCVEFQHSYINLDFEERNTFYRQLGIKTIWIYDLTTQNVKNENGYYYILENNAKGFFRIAENPKNLEENIVFIQTKDKRLYLVNKLDRKEIDNEKKSTIRWFKPVIILEPEDFVERLKNGDLVFMDIKMEKTLFPKQEGIINQVGESREMSLNHYNYENQELKSVAELWNPSYYFMILYNPKTRVYIRIEKSRKIKGDMERAGKYNHVLYQIVNWDSKNKKYYGIPNSSKTMSWEEEKEKNWILVRDFYDWYK